MNFSKKQLSYGALSEFNKQLRQGLFTEENVVYPAVKFNSLDLPDNDVEKENFWGFKLKKDGKVYLFSLTDRKGNEINIKDKLPFKIKGKTTRVANGKDVYYQIHDIETFKFSERQTMSFRKLIELLAGLRHSNYKHYLLGWFNAFTSISQRHYYRLSTPAGFGKDSTVDIIGNLIGKVTTIESPTMAKLEHEVTLRSWLLVNEVCDITKEKWKIVEAFLLSCGAFKPTVNKSSRSYQGSGEELDISDNSIALSFNDIDHYRSSTGYFDDVAKEAVKDRFIPFRLYGRFIEDFNALEPRDVEAFVKEHFDDYLELIHNIMYYKNHLKECGHGYMRKEIKLPSERHKLCLTSLLETVDVYSETQEEFTEWQDIIIHAINDYKSMLIYMKVLPNLYKKLKIPKDEYEKYKQIDDCRVDNPIIETIKKAKTFMKKCELIENFDNNNKANYKDDISFWEK